MKRTLFPCLGQIIWLTLTITCASLSTSVAQNLLLDPGFEDPANQASWSFFGNGEVLRKVTGHVPTEAYDGLYALYAPAGIIGTSSGASQVVSATAGSSMTFSGYVLNSIHNELRLGCYGLTRIEFLSATGETPLATVESGQLAKTTGDWVPFSIEGDAPDGTARARLTVMMWQGSISDAYGSLYFDALSAQEISGVPEVDPRWIAPGLMALAAALRSRGRSRFTRGTMAGYKLRAREQ